MSEIRFVRRSMWDAERGGVRGCVWDGVSGP